MENEEYDVVICGTGITESILSGLLSLDGLKVLHIDKNQYYGDEGASVNLTTLFDKLGKGLQPPEALGHNRDWNIDLLPKFVMSGGDLVKMLIKTKVSDYINWKSIDSCYIYQYSKGGFFSKAGGKIEKIPGTETEALKSGLMSLLEKRRFAKLLKYVDETDFEKVTKYKDYDLSKTSFKQFCDKCFGLCDSTIDFLTNGVALYTNDYYINKACLITLKRIKIYVNSIHNYGNTPFIYPIYGLSMIPEGFARKCAVYGGTFMLDQKIEQIHFNDEKKVFKVTQGDDKTAFCKQLIVNPSYLIDCGMKDRLNYVGKGIRRICILEQPLTKDNSYQIIIPQKQTGRKNDIYIMMVNYTFNICRKNYFIAIISTQAETDNPEHELKVAYELMGKILFKFELETDMYVPKDTNFDDNVFITNSLDPTSHYGSVATNVKELYKKITGKELDLNIKD